MVKAISEDELDIPTERATGWVHRSDEIRQRDGHKCQVCGKTIGVEVHHIVPGKKLPVKHARKDRNLVTVCSRHHGFLERSTLAVQFRSINWWPEYHAIRLLGNRTTVQELAKEAKISPEKAGEVLDYFDEVGVGSNHLDDKYWLHSDYKGEDSTNGALEASGQVWKLKTENKTLREEVKKQRNRRRERVREVREENREEKKKLKDQLKLHIEVAKEVAKRGRGQELRGRFSKMKQELRKW